MNLSDTIYTDDEGITYRVMFFYTPGDPGCISGPSDSWVEPSPAELEVVSVTLEDGTVIDVEELGEDFQDKLEAACFESIESAIADAALNNLDCWRD